MGDKYKFRGMKDDTNGQVTNQIILEGSSTNPTKLVEVGGEAVEIEEDLVKELRASGHDLVKVNEKGDEDDDDNPEEVSDTAEGESPQRTPAAIERGVGTTGNPPKTPDKK